MLTVANPIYDVVFKYLMEDNRVARTILSALLQKEVLEVELRPHEYTNKQRDTLSVFRIDFAAKVRKDDGSVQVILIELQKTWLETETLRFRQYLGTQYSNPENMTADGYALPMVAVYLLGHRVGQIEEPVLYVHHQAEDYLGHKVIQGLPDPFVDSLTHDSIVVQIPLLSGKVNSRLYKVLSIFDQTRKDKLNGQVICLQDGAYDGDRDMEYIVRRLQTAAADAELRREMMVEDEFFSVIEKRYTEIMLLDLELANKNVQIKQKEAELEQKDAQLEQKDAQLEQKDAQLEQKDAQLEQKDAQLEQKDAQLEQKDALIRTSIQAFSKLDLSAEDIAAQLHLTVEEVKAYL
jgi:hypothetical protein